MLQLVFQCYSSGNSGQVLYDMNHLQSLTLRGDTAKNLETFHNTWNMVLTELQTQPEPSLLQYWHFKQLKGFKPLSDDIAHYRRAQYNVSSDYSFEWLWAAACRYLAMTREDYMQGALNQTLNNKAHAALAPGYGGDKKPKPKPGKGQGDRARSNSVKLKTGKGGKRDLPPKGGARGRSPKRRR